MKVYLVWYSQKWSEPELCDVFEKEEDANKFRDKLASKLTQKLKKNLHSSYYVEPHEVRGFLSKESSG